MEEEEEEEVPMLIIDEVSSVDGGEKAPLNVQATKPSSVPAVTTLTSAVREQHEVDEKPKKSVLPPVPLCILTGWLGAGKTTLLQRILKELGGKGMKVAIVQNEVSAAGVEDGLMLKDDNGVFGEMLELANGCVCCSVKADFALAVETLLRKRHFDYVFVECSGLADPGPLARMFWVDEELESNLYLDSIVSLADAKHLEGHLRDEATESLQVIRQLAFADNIILNKRDLVDDTTIEKLKNQLRRLNMAAKINVTQQSNVPLEEILHMKSFDPSHAARVAGIENDFSLSVDKLGECTQGCTVDHEHVHTGHSHTHSNATSIATVDDKTKEATQHVHVHDHSITTHVLSNSVSPVSLLKFKGWLGDLLWEYQEGNGVEEESDVNNVVLNSEDKALHTMEIFRMKALIWVEGEERQYFLQGVQSLFEIEEGSTSWEESGSRMHTKVVVIGRHLDIPRLEREFKSCLV